MVAYRPVEKIHEAGQGSVWRAVNEDTGGNVALKYLRDAGPYDSEAISRDRFSREIRAQSQLRHTGVMPILGYNFEHSPPFYVMPLAAESLASRLERSGRLTESEMIGIMTPVLEAMRFAHEQGIIHRDLKPSNILMVATPTDPWSFGDWVVADFGLCRNTNSDSITITRTNVAIGSFAYMSPEQYRDSHRVGPTTDIYSLGRIIYHCLTGDSGFPRQDIAAVPTRYHYFIEKATAHERSDRYMSVARMIEDLNALTNLEVTSNPKELCAQLVAQVRATGDQGAAAQLADILIRNQTDEYLFVELVPILDADVLRLAASVRPGSYGAIISTFDRACSGSFPFNFTDRIADFFAGVFRVSVDARDRGVALRRILDVGYSHNRYYVRTVFCELLSSLDGPDAAMAASILRDNPEAAAFIAVNNSVFSYAPVIRDALTVPTS